MHEILNILWSFPPQKTFYTLEWELQDERRELSHCSTLIRIVQDKPFAVKWEEEQAVEPTCAAARLVIRM